MKYLIVAMFTMFMSCETTSTEDGGCGEGTEISVENTTYCVFKSDITETGFSCPADFSNETPLDGGTLCSTDAVSIPELLDVQKEVDEKWNPRVSVGQNPTVVECDDITKTVDYCAAERLDWAYDAASKVLTLTDKRVVLNCCGRREMGGAYLVKGVYELTIVDEPEEGDLRCNCSCVFDFGIEIPNVEPGKFEFEISQTITDAEDPKENRKYTDSIDIPAENGSGSVELIVNNADIACAVE